MSLTTHTRTKIEIIVEQPHLSRVVKLLEAEQVRGYTAFKSHSGKGSHGEWMPNPLSDAEDRILLIAVVDGDTADRILAQVASLFATLPGVAFTSEVRVLRPERF